MKKLPLLMKLKSDLGFWGLLGGGVGNGLYIFSVLDIGLMTLSFAGLELLLMVIFGLIYNHIKDEVGLKQDSLFFLKDLLFYLRWGTTFVEAVKKANRRLEKRGITIDPMSEFTDIECRKLSAGSLTSVLSDIVCRFQMRSPVLAKSSIIRKRLGLELEQTKHDLKNLASFRSIMNLSSAVLFLALSVISVYRKILSLYNVSFVTCGLGLTFGLFDLTVIYLLLDYRKELI